MNYDLLNEMLDCFKCDSFSSFVAESYATLNEAERELWKLLRDGLTIDEARCEQLKLF